MIEFFFEFASPYSYLASLELPAMAERYGAKLLWRPIDIAKVWEAQGVLDSYGAIRRLKSGYIAADAARVAAARGVKLTFPATSGNPAPARLVFYALAATDPARAVAFAQAVWRRRFKGEATSEPGDLVAAFPGLSAEWIAAACADPVAAGLLAASNDAAVASRCFGAPWVLCGSQTFFGQDRLYLLETVLKTASAASASRTVSVEQEGAS